MVQCFEFKKKVIELVIIYEKFDRPITVVGGGECCPEALEKSLKIAPTIIVSDGGLNKLDYNIHNPRWLVGDMDSVEDPVPWIKRGTLMQPILEQKTTDFEKSIYSFSAPAFLANGVLGGRMDHALASCSTLIKYKNKTIILVGKYDIIFHLNFKITLNLPIGLRFSLFPLQKSLGVRSDGLRYDIAGIQFEPGSFIGTSNEVVSNKVKIEVSGLGVLIILPSECLTKELVRAIKMAVQY